MKKNKIIISCAYVFVCLIVYAAIFLVVAWLTFGYYAKEKFFEKEGCTITLTNNFIERDNERYTAYYYSDDLLVTTLEIPFDVFSNEWDAEKKCGRICGAYAN